jgi:spore germination protein GerM
MPPQPLTANGHYPYHTIVAVQKSGGRKNTGQTAKKTPGKSHKSSQLPLGVIFWLAFFLLIIGLFLVNREIIRKTLDDTQLISRLTNRGGGTSEKPAPVPVSPMPPDPRDAPVKETPPVQKPAAQTAAPAAPAAKPPEAADKPAAPAAKPAAAPAEKPAAKPTQPPAPAAKPEAPASRERTLYFTQVDKDGAILRTRVTRKIPASDSPMLDSLTSLLAGPSTEEQRRGFVSLIPQGTRVLSAIVRGSTAYISFSEEFQYNTYGVEGYAAQLKQIVWTVTEFSNVKDVQILIEGRRIDYLGEGIWIGSPLGRDSI